MTAISTRPLDYLQTHLFIKKWSCPNPKALVLFVHGYGEHTTYYEEFAEFLNNLDILCYGYDQRGFGKSRGDLATFRANHYVTDLQDVVHLVHHVHPKLPVYVMGFELGALVTLASVIERSSGIKGIILAGTPYGLGQNGSSVNRTILSILKPFVKNLALVPATKPGDYSNDRDVVSFRQEDRETVRGAWHVGFAFSFYALLSDIRKNLQKVQIPVFVLHGGKDRAVPVSHATQLVQALKSKDVSHQYFQDATHALHNGLQRKAVYRSVADWITSRL